MVSAWFPKVRSLPRPQESSVVIELWSQDEAPHQWRHDEVSEQHDSEYEPGNRAHEVRHRERRNRQSDEPDGDTTSSLSAPRGAVDKLTNPRDINAERARWEPEQDSS
jgi:hypothetical protein